MRCLWVTRLLPYSPFVGGDATYSACLIQSLAAAGADVTVLCSDNGASAPVTGDAKWVIVPFADRGRVRSLLGREPTVVFRFSTPDVRVALSTLLAEQSWDAVLIDSLAMAGVLDLYLDARQRDRARLLAYVSHNHEEVVRQRLATAFRRWSPKGLAVRWDAVKTSWIERALIAAADLVTVNTSYDADLYRLHAPDQRYLVLTPGYDGPRVVARKITAQTPRRIALLGSYAWIAKQVNLRRFLEAGAEALARAGIGIDVIGSAPKDFVDRLRTAFPSVTVTGPVDRVEPHLARARLGIIAEEIGGGFKHKVLSYVFNRVPIAALAGSVVGTPLVPGEGILEFPDLDRLINGVIEIIDDLARLNLLHETAFSACEGRFAWMDRGRALADHLEHLRAEHQTAGGRNERSARVME